MTSRKTARFGIIAAVFLVCFGWALILLNPIFTRPPTLEEVVAQARTIKPWAVDGYADPRTSRLSGEIEAREMLAAYRLGIKFDTTHLPVAGTVATYFPPTRAISLSPTFSSDARAEIIAHELAHALQPPRVEFTHGESEVFAVSVSYLVVSHAQCDADCVARYTNYLSQHKTSLDVASIYRPEITFAAELIWGE
jgi:hypothetical protein